MCTSTFEASDERLREKHMELNKADGDEDDNDDKVRSK